MPFDRRDLLRRSLLAASVALVGRLRSLRADDAGQGERVLVVGAGVAGLAAARALRAAGRQVVVVEGRERIGGRVVTSRAWPDMPCDLGASWIQGTRGNPLTELAEEWGIETKATDPEEATIYRADGQRVTEAEAAQSEAHLQALLMELEAQRSELGADAAKLALGPALERLIAEAGLEPTARRDLQQLLCAALESELGADLGELSLLYFDAADGHGGASVVFPKGYDQIPRRLAEGLDVRLGQAITAIEHNASGVVVKTTSGSFAAERVVVTLPLGVLKRGTVTFQPALTEAKRGAIERLGMGLLNKLWLRFPRAFWGERDNDLIGFVGERRGAWPETVDFQRVFGKPVLLCFQSGSVARAAEALSDERLVASAMGWIRAAFGKDAPEPVAYQVTRWAADPFAYGSYSYFAKGSTPADVAALAAPVGGRVFFAGEATSPDHPATVHGAYASGLRAAEEVLSV